MTNKSSSKKRLPLFDEVDQMMDAKNMVELGARMQVLQAETDLPRRKLMELYKEIAGTAPPKGMLPSSEDWFLWWIQNVESSLFAVYYMSFIRKGVARKRAMIKAYRMYQDQLSSEGREGVLTFSRAWTLIRFMDANILQLSECHNCGSEFVSHTCETKEDTCTICNPPARTLPIKKLKQ